MDNDFDNIDIEEWEGDSLLIEDEDWPGLVKLRKQRAEKRPSDFLVNGVMAKIGIYKKPKISYCHTLN